MNHTSQMAGETAADWQQRESDLKASLALKHRLEVVEGEMIKWLCTGLRAVVKYPGVVDPAKISAIQAQLNKASDYLAIIYIWALLDEHGFGEGSRWVTSDRQLELAAWKHVRHTGAHAPGQRARHRRQEFEDYMTGQSQALSGLRQNCTWSANSIALNSGMSYDFFRFAVNAVNEALSNSANHPSFTP